MAISWRGWSDRKTWLHVLVCVCVCNCESTNVSRCIFCYVLFCTPSLRLLTWLRVQVPIAANLVWLIHLQSSARLSTLTHIVYTLNRVCMPATSSCMLVLVTGTVNASVDMLENVVTVRVLSGSQSFYLLCSHALKQRHLPFSLLQPSVWSSVPRMYRQTSLREWP